MNIILIVDDDTTSLKLAKGILDDEYRVATVNSGAMVFKYLANNTPDLILLDINMPDMDGFEVLGRLKEKNEWSSIPVIFLTANQDPQSEARCLEAGAIDYVGKPFVPVVLLNRVRRIMELYGYRHQLESMLANQSQVILNRTERIARMQNSIILGMANLIELRDNNTGRHVKNTQVYVEMICTALRERNLFTTTLTDFSAFSSADRQTYCSDQCAKFGITEQMLVSNGMTNESFKKISYNDFLGLIYRYSTGDNGGKAE